MFPARLKGEAMCKEGLFQLVFALALAYAAVAGYE